MKICFITPYYPPLVKGGMEISLSLLVRALVEKGHEIYIFTPNYNGKNQVDGENPKIFRLGWFSDSVFLRTNPLSTNLFAKKVISFASDFDIIDAYSWFQPAKILSEKLKIPYVCSVRDATPICDFRVEKNPYEYSFFEYFQKRFSTYGFSPRQVINAIYGNFLTRQNLKVLSEASCLSFASDALRDVFEKYNSCGEVVGSIRPSQFKKTNVKVDGINFSKDKVVVYAGRLSEGKGAGFLFEAAKKVVVKDKTIKFVFVGDGELKDDISNKRFADQIFSLGRKDHDFVLSLVEKSRLTVIPSLIFEGFPRMGVESVSLGVPVIGTDIGGIGEAIGDAGILVRPGNIQELSEVILEVCNNHDLYKRLKEKTKIQADKFTPEKISKKVLEMYRKVL